MTIEVKNCPFCGSTCKIEFNSFGDSIIESYRVICVGNNEHALDSWHETEEEAISEWNERVTEPITVKIKEDDQRTNH